MKVKFSTFFCLLLFTFYGYRSVAQLTPLALGSISPRDSVIVLFTVSVNNPLPAGTAYIATQATVAGTNVTSLVTDDPDTGLALDSTKTLLNMFPLPVNFITFQASEQNGHVNLAWKVAQQYRVDRYEVERSTDGRTFSKIGTVAAIASTNEMIYRFDDGQPLPGVAYYRIRSVDGDGQYKYTHILKLQSNAKQSIAVNPNPVTGHLVTLGLNNLEKGRYQLELINPAGQTVYRRTITYAGGSVLEQIALPLHLKGACLVRVQNGKAVSYQKLLIMQ